MRRFLAIFSLTFLFHHGAGAQTTPCPTDTQSYRGAVDQDVVFWCLDDDEREGPLEVQSVEGKTLLKANYKEDKLDGPFEKYYDNGRLWMRGEYKDGEATGTWQSFWPDGKPHSDGQFADGKPDGLWKFNDEEGKLVEEKDYSYKAQDTNFHVRAGIFSVKPGDNIEEADGPFIGLDYLLWHPTRWFKIQVALDFSNLKVTSHDYSSTTSSTMTHNVDVLLASLNPEFNWPSWPLTTLGFRIGSLTAYTEKNKDQKGFAGAEFRRRFKNKHFLGLDSIFLFLGGFTDNKDNQQNTGPQAGPGPGPNPNYSSDGPEVVYLGLTFGL